MSVLTKAAKLTKELFPPSKIILYEQVEWEDYEGTGQALEYASDSAYQDLRQLKDDDWIRLAQDVLRADRPRGGYFLDEETEEPKLVEAVEGDDPHLETFAQLVRDAAVFSWEALYTPSQSDLDEAVDLARREMIDDAYEHFHEIGMSDIIEIQEERQAAVVKSLLGQVSLDKMELSESFWKSQFLQDVVSSGEYLIFPEEGETRVYGVFEGNPLPTEDVERAVKRWREKLDWLWSGFLSLFWKHLKKTALVGDYESPDFNEQWKIILKDKGQVAAAAKGIREVVGRKPRG